MRNDGYVVQCYRSCFNLRSSCTVRPLSAPVLHMYLCFVYRNFLPQQISLTPSVRGQSRLTFHDSFRLLPLWQERPIICISTFHIKSLRPLKLESLGTLVIHIAFTSFYHELPNPCAPPDYHPKNPKFYTQPYNAERRARRQNDIRISHVLPVPQRALCVPSFLHTRGAQVFFNSER